MEIPVLHMDRTVGTQEDKQTGERENPAKREGVYGRQNRHNKLKREGD